MKNKTAELIKLEIEFEIARLSSLYCTNIQMYIVTNNRSFSKKRRTLVSFLFDSVDIMFSEREILRNRVRCCGVIWIRISGLRSLRSWFIKGTGESTLVMDSPVPSSACVVYTKTIIGYPSLVYTKTVDSVDGAR